MEKVGLTKVGESHYLLVPKTIVELFNLLVEKDDYEYEFILSKDKNSFIYKRVKKEK